MNKFRDKVKNKRSMVNIIITIQLSTIIDIASSMALFCQYKMTKSFIPLYNWKCWLEYLLPS